MSADVIDFAGLRRTDGLTSEDRIKARTLVRGFGAELTGCPTAARETGSIAHSCDRSPLKPHELQALRTMLVQFEAIKRYCPTARRLVESLEEG